MLKRVLSFLAGMIFVSLGIVLCKKCSMGISPVSSIPYVLSLALPLTFGRFTMLFHFVNTIGQMILQKKVTVKLALQFLLSFGFSFTIDLLDGWIRVDSSLLLWCTVSLLLSIFFTALGMVIMFRADLVQNPVDGFVKQVAEMTKRPVGTIKIYYDCSCVLISLALSFLFLHQLKGFGIATIVSAIFVGKCVGWLKKAEAKLFHSKV